MLRVGQLWRTSGPLADASERPPGVGAWGEGLVERSLTTLWYPSDWSEVGDDELVLVLPTLTTWRPGRSRAAARSNDGPVGYLTRTLAARAAAAATLISSNASDAAAASRLRVRELLVSRAILTAIPMKDLAAAAPGPAAHLPIAAEAPARGSGAASENMGAGENMADWLVLELTALAHLDRLLLDARGMQAGADGEPLVDWPLSLPDVVLATIHARLNGLYVHPQFVDAHELLTAAALLGHLACGRAAYMPPHVAQSLVDILSGKRKGHCGEDACAAIMRMYAEIAGGANRMLWHARRAAASGRPYLIRPRRPVAPSDTGRTTWNARLLQRIARRWQLSA